MIKNMLGKMTTTTTNTTTGGEREATPPRDVPKRKDDSDASSGASSAQQVPNHHHHQSSPKTFAEKFAMSLDDISFVDGEDAHGGRAVYERCDDGRVEKKQARQQHEHRRREDSKRDGD